tara:strand:+ start:3557 stop:4039 length:483 start_codon:yes stop_codon:yes gene_type:complete
MSINKTILIIGACGSGKTWVMKQIITQKELTLNAKFGMIRFKTDKELAVLGKYDGQTFEGSDRLSMAVARDFEKFKKLADKNNLFIICEGDRFTNRTFIKTFNPYIIKIKDNGEQGRKLRGSNQTERHIRAIQTRVNNITHTVEVENSSEALKRVLELIS